MDNDGKKPIDLNAFAYRIIKQACLSQDYYVGFSKALYYAKICMNADNIIIFKNDGIDGEFEHKYNQALMSGNSEPITELLNNNANVEDNLGIFTSIINTDDGEQAVIFVPITIRDSKYVIAITGRDREFIVDEKVLTTFAEAMQIVMDKVKTVNDLIRDSEFDKLTQLRNRNSYETDTSQIISTNGMVLGLFDLFRLKTINDNYSHDKGDEYIVGAAKILNKYFPEYVITKDENGRKQKVATGTRLYRTGGDEFILITPDSLESVEIRAHQAVEELRQLDLGIPEEIGLNLGIVRSESNESVKQLTIRADESLREDKSATYKRLGIDRRQAK